MKISIITLFPQMFDAVLNSSILKRAQNKGLVEFELADLRQFGEGVHQIVDDRPYGGGAGMVLKADVLARALTFITSQSPQENASIKVILTSASGKSYTQAKARELSRGEEDLVIICGHYEGVDQRFIDHYVDEELSVGDYVVTGGEIPAMMIVDSITRLIPGVLEKESATLEESYEQGLLEYPHYTRPDVFEGLSVPEILTSGNHLKIEQWRREQSIERTKKIRPDLLER